MTESTADQDLKAEETAAIIPAVSSLLAAGAALFAFGGQYTFAKYHLGGWPWAGVALLAAALVAFPRTRGGGGFLGSVVLATLAWTTLVVWRASTDNTFKVSDFEITSGEAFTFSVLFMLVWGASLFWTHRAARDRQILTRELLADVQQRLGIAQATVAENAEARSALVAGNERHLRDAARARKDDAAKAAEQIATLKRKRLYEAQYVGGFLVALGFRIARVFSTRPFTINYLQGARDAALADLVSAVAGRYWLIEFKRSEAELKDEYTKHARQGQIEALKSNERMLKTADACHFIAWGVERTGIPNLSISRYVDLWRSETQLIAAPLRQMEKFLEDAIPAKDQTSAIGVSATVFREYLRLLERCGGCAPGEADFAALVMHQNDKGQLCYFTEHSFSDLAHDVGEIEREVQQQKQNIWDWRKIDPDPPKMSL